MGMDRIAERLGLPDGAQSVTVRRLSVILACSPTYLQKLIRAGSLVAGKVGSDYRIPLEEAVRLAREAKIIRD